MKTKHYFHFLFPAILAMISIQACSSDDDGLTVTQIKTFVSIGTNDGFIENLSTLVVHEFFSRAQGKSLCIGWNTDGYSMRSYLSFDVSQIMPSSDKELI